MKHVSAVFIYVISGLTTFLADQGHAQVDPGVLDIVQYDAKVGVIFVPERPESGCEYTEYWYLFENYQYPGADKGIATTLIPVEKDRSSVDYFESMKAQHPEGHMVHVEVHDHRAACSS